jgi:hypothetical protein
MRVCSNCNSQITCGCQDRIATDGKLACSSCVANYEQELINKKVAESNNFYSSNTDENIIK